MTSPESQSLSSNFNLDFNGALKLVGPPSTYEYQTIDSANSELRLLNLLPGCGEDEIQYRLRTVRLSEHTRHQCEALSCVWGSSLKSAGIKTLGKEHRTDEPPITQSLAEAHRLEILRVSHKQCNYGFLDCSALAWAFVRPMKRYQNRRTW